MTDKGARIISYLLHPIFMPLIFFYLAFNSNSELNYLVSDNAKWQIYKIILIITVVAPLLSVLVMYTSKMISGIEMQNRRERILPFFLTMFYYGLTAYILRQAHLPDGYYAFLGGTICALFFAIVITIKWKISVHMIGIGGLIGGVWAMPEVFGGGDNISMLLSLLLLAGIVGTARIVSKTHQPLQIYIGAIVGFICVNITMLVMLS